MNKALYIYFKLKSWENTGCVVCWGGMLVLQMCGGASGTLPHIYWSGVHPEREKGPVIKYTSSITVLGGEELRACEYGINRVQCVVNSSTILTSQQKMSSRFDPIVYQLQLAASALVLL